MKKLLMVLCFVVSIVSLSKAQGGGGGGRMRMSPADQLKAMQTACNLTTDQSTKVLAILTASAASRDSLMKAGGDRTAMRPIMQAQNAKIQAVLTDDQKTAWTKYMADMRAKMQGGGGGGGTPPPPQK